MDWACLALARLGLAGLTRLASSGPGCLGNSTKLLSVSLENGSWHFSQIAGFFFLGLLGRINLFLSWGRSYRRIIIQGQLGGAGTEGDGEGYGIQKQGLDIARTWETVKIKVVRLLQSQR